MLFLYNSSKSSTSLGMYLPPPGRPLDWKEEVESFSATKTVASATTPAAKEEEDDALSFFQKLAEED